MADDPARDAQERGWREIAEIDAAYQAGQIDRDGWHRAMLALVEPAYLAAQTLEGGSGHNGSPQEWDESRSIVMAAVDRSGSFLDVGCANGLLMESVRRWAVARNLNLEPYGVDISARLVDLARGRCPQWADRIWCANAADWKPARRFDYVRTATEYVPADYRISYLRHLLDSAVAPGGRLIVGKLNELRSDRSMAQQARDAGMRVVGEVRRPSRHPNVEHTVFWVDIAE